MDLPYDKIVKHFDETRKAIWKSVGIFLDSLPSNSLVLDVGCGNGKYMRYRKDITVIGTDITSEFFELLDKEICVYGNGIHKQMRDSVFDHAISIAVLHHIKAEYRLQFIQNIVDQVIKNGTILITVWSAEQIIKDKWVNIDGTDYMIPWLDKYSKKTYMRYYHLFYKDELLELINKVKNVKVDSLIYEKDNWTLKLNIL